MIRYSKNSLKQLRLFSFFILFAFASCEKPEPTGGFDLLPAEDALSAFQTDTVTITTGLLRDDSVRTDELSASMLGSYLDPLLGFTQAGFYTQLQLSTSSETFPTAIEIDSVVLALVYSTSSDPYGKKAQQGFSVSEVTEEIFIDSTYYPYDRTAHFPSNLVEPFSIYQTFNPDEDVVVGGDTLVPQLRLHLKKELGLQLLNPTVSGALESNDAFQDYFKGLYVETERRDAQVASFSLVDPDSKLIVYYRDLSGDEPDTTNYDFLITSTCARYTTIERWYTGALAGLNAETMLDGNVNCYAQGGGGVQTVIEFPYLENFNEFDRRTINRAQLLIPFDNDLRLPPHDRLFLLYRNEEGRYVSLPDENSGTIGGGVNRAQQLISFDIGRYVLQRLNGDIPAGPLYLLSSSAGVTVTRTPMHGPRFNPAVKQENMRLIITLSN
jgi:hypothetical protein